MQLGWSSRCQKQGERWPKFKGSRHRPVESSQLNVLSGKVSCPAEWLPEANFTIPLQDPLKPCRTIVTTMHIFRVVTNTMACVGLQCGRSSTAFGRLELVSCFCFQVVNISGFQISFLGFMV